MLGEVGLARDVLWSPRARPLHEENTMNKTTQAYGTTVSLRLGTLTGLTALLLTASVGLTTGCASKKYVRSQTTPLIQQTNDLDAKTAGDHRNIVDTDERAHKTIAGAQGAADAAGQHADAAGQAATTAGQSAQE